MKKLTVPSEPRLSTNKRAERRERTGKKVSFCKNSKSPKKSKYESKLK